MSDAQPPLESGHRTLIRAAAVGAALLGCVSAVDAAPRPVDPLAGTTIVAPAGTTLFARPKAGSRVLGGIDAGAEVHIIASRRNIHGHWLYVRVGEQAGWLPHAPPASAPAIADTADTGAPAPVAARAPIASPSGFLGSADQQRAQALLATRAAPEAYAHLAAIEDAHVGDPYFDYLYGTSAYDSGRYSETVFILQRAVAAEPRMSGARMELARAYFTLGDNEPARREFVTLQQQDPPPATARVIAQYLSAIDERAARYEPQLRGFLEAGAGYDSNANGAPDADTFLGFTLDQRNQATDSGFYSLGLGASGSYPVLPDWALKGGAQLLHRTYPGASFVDADFVRVASVLEWRVEELSASAGPSVSLARLGDEKNHDTAGIDMSGAYTTERWQASLNGRYSRLDYIEALSAQDVETQIVGVAGSFMPEALPRVRFGAALTIGRDAASRRGSPYGRDLNGVRAAASLDLGRGHGLTLSLAALESDYDGLFFGEPRSDSQTQVTLDHAWSAHRHSGWTVGAQLGYLDNRSDVPLYDYDRLDIGVSIRREFR